MAKTRRLSSYETTQDDGERIPVDELSRSRLLEAVRIFCDEATDEMLRGFIKDIIDHCDEQLAR